MKYSKSFQLHNFAQSQLMRFHIFTNTFTKFGKRPIDMTEKPTQITGIAFSEAKLELKKLTNEN